ncbi:cache domain-containing protein [Neiella marina]|uniref:Cache domain-containing protein n=1 Tax=Neiella holothuriorum TaxID=2870530 RepID=A0ABS7ECG4_9GAMM|nr:cache domain-containing protein [Neiella holothuriorum]MBW8189653.1 cache domain-containing protein [Neiella holothuriorum]
MEAFVNQNQRQLMDSMPSVTNCKNQLDHLNSWWGKISLIGKINSYNIDTMIFSDMNATKEKLGDLQQHLIENLLTEEVKKKVLDSGSRAQVAIDILIRNLFERTADVGFLATDSDIRNFLQLADASHLDIENLRERLVEYVKKYSVYHDIIITDTKGDVKVQLDTSNPIVQTHDPLINDAINSSADYLEVYRHTDMKPAEKNSLIYACKITTSNQPNSKVIGVLCLFFKFEDEMKGIFEDLNSDNSSYLMLVDQHGEIQASNHSCTADLSRMEPSLTPEIINFNHNSYITISAKTKGYQGFHGLNWYGRSMLPVNETFPSGISEDEVKHNGNALTNLTQSSLFSSTLKQIYFNSRDVNEDLKLIVLNGIITAAREDAAEFVPVLEEIKKIGDNTAAIFGESILRLRNTVLSSQLQSMQFIARLAVDIMDRNLYERANDCRWWALTTGFRKLLAKDSLSADEQSELTATLVYINELYTVYTNLYLYDKNGEILSVSNPNERQLIGQHVDDSSGAAQALKIKDSQQYSVSNFVSSPYYNDKPTYIYNASITDLNNSERVLGGIGIVFDSEPQFKDMLTDTLPRNERGSVVEGCFGVFVSRDGRVISSTNESLATVGTIIPLEASQVLSIENGQSLAELMTFNGRSYVVGISASSGYREYKTTSDYTNDVVCLIFLPF